MDYKNLKFEGTLEKILYSEKRKPEEALYKIIAPAGPITLTRLEIALEDGGSYMPEFMAEVPQSSVGKKVVLKESLKTRGNKKTISQELQIEGNKPILTTLQYRIS